MAKMVTMFNKEWNETKILEEDEIKSDLTFILRKGLNKLKS